MKASYLGLLAMAVAVPSLRAQQAKLQINLTGNDRIEHTHIRYTCDANAAKLKLPTTAFTVEYIRGAGNTLAVVPVEGYKLIFASVISASGERYAAGRYIWGDKGSEAWLTRIEHDRPDDPTTYCHEVK